MADKKQRVTIGDLRGGRNGVDPPLSLRGNECVDAVNVEWYHTTLGRKRNGMTAADTMFSSGGPFTGKLSSLFRHVPGTDETLSEQWAVDDAGVPVLGRRAGSTFFTAPTLKDPLSGYGWNVDFASIGGKLFITYPAGSGFTAPAAPTVADTGAGTYAAVLRYYRVRWITQVGGLTTARSAVGTSQSFTPSGAGTAARATRPAAPSQGETHWELEVSYDNTVFRVLYGDGGLNAPIAIATTTGDDSTTLTGTSGIDTFHASGTWVRPSWVNSVSYLVVGAGGGGAGAQGVNLAGGGGGAGGMRTGTLSVSASSYSVTVGAGGAGGVNNASGASGGSSVFSTITSAGGGGGGATTVNGVAGGSGGGGGGTNSGVTQATGGAGTGGQGTAGGNGSVPTEGDGGGGGGGATGAGANAGNGTGGNGGAGTSSSISGSAVTYAGGGGGGGLSAAGTGGAGGGGNGGAFAGGSAGTANRGGGGGGAGDDGGGGRTGGAGGSGIVILSYTASGITSAGLSNADNTDRLHVWDGSTVRRAGFAVPAVPTVADSASGGAYAATARHYRVRWAEQSGGVTVRRSEPSVSVAFTPSGAATAAVVTRPAVASEGETHWEVEASTDNVTFYRLSAVVIATTTYSDTALVATYTTNTVSALTGTHTAQKSYRFIAADQGRLLGFGNFTATAKQNDIEVSAVVGSLDVGDVERVNTTQTYRYTLDENDSGAPTGLRGPVFGNFYAFKTHQLWELAPTGLPTNPYRRTPISKTIGCVQRAASCIGEDEQGNAAIYFMSTRGLYRYGSGGLTYVGKGIEDYILGPTATMNRAATNVVAWTLYYPPKKQVWVGWATGSSNDPCQTAFYDVQSGGWSRIPTGDLAANIRCAALFSNTPGAAMSPDLKPYLGSALTANVLYKADDATVTQDAGTNYKGYVLTGPVEAGGPGYNGSVGDAVLLAATASGVTITATVIPNFDSTYAKTGTALLTPNGSETRVTRRLAGSSLSGQEFVQYQIGDAVAANTGWALDRLTVAVSQDEAVGG